MAWFGIGKSKAKEKALRKAAKNKKVESQQKVANSTLVTVDNLTKPNESGWYTIADGDTWMKKHEHIISLIYSNLRLTDFHRDMYYTSAIRNYCRLVQALPASEYHHHSYAGGLIEHTLQVAKYAIIYARKFMFSENNKEIELEEQFDVFAYACFTAALMHDAGKIITDFDLVSWDGTLNPNGSRKATVLMPLNMQQADVGIEYMWRYCATRNKAAHESAAAALIQPIIPVEGLYWLRTCPSLWQQWFHTISGRHNFGGDIAEVIKYCDSHSVEVSLQTNNSKAGSGSKNTRHTLAERYVIAIRQLIESSALPLNRPGAAGFVYEDYLYLVSQRSIEAATPLVKNAGGTGIPKNVATIFSLLCDAGIALRHPVTNDVIHTLHIRLNTGDGWDGELTFLKFPIDEIDPNGVLGLVPADLELTDKTEEKGFNAKQHKKADSSVVNDTGSDNDSNEPVFNLAAQMDSLTTANDSKTDSADDILSSVNKLFEDTQSQLLPNHKKGKPKKDNKDKSSSNNAVSNIKEPKEPASGGLMDLDMSDFAGIDSVSTSSVPEQTPDNSSEPISGGLMDLDMSDFADIDSVSTSPEPEQTPDNSSEPISDGFMDLDMSDFAGIDSVSTSSEPEQTPDHVS
ncbi:MobH family relaxase [Photobacterium leiognathi]|uniref:MobH family relaxase n=1 Tax=Photobacterium leiognathi TaxID=553611 RepID=UPI00273926B9|nr:MobH family relaxase [Photobacterium leiognathi]